MAHSHPTMLKNIELTIDIGEYPLKISIPKETTVKAITAIIRDYKEIHQEYGPTNSEFLCLASADDNPLIDFLLVKW